MATQLYEGSLEVEIALVEAEYPSLESPRGYPSAWLVPTSKVERRTFKSWILENDLLKVTVAPEIGGRIWSIFDKRAALDVLPQPTTSICSAGGPRGAYLASGVQLRLSDHDRLNSLGPVIAQPGPEDEGLQSLWLGSIELGTNLSHYWILSLADDDACLQAEVRVFNRSLSAVEYDPAVAAYFPAAENTLLRPGCAAAYHRERDCGLALTAMQAPMDRATCGEDRLVLGRFSKPTVIAPRQTDQWAIRIAPLSSLATLTQVGDGLAMSVGSELRVQACTEQSGPCKIVLHSSGGERFEAPVALNPSSPVIIPLTGDLASPSGIEIFGPQRESLLAWPSESPEIAPKEIEVPSIRWPERLTHKTWRDLTFSPIYRYLAHVHLAVHALAKSDWAGALQGFENSLMFNADDPLSWWGKALASRLSGIESEENNDLLNAHFLSPFEPMLRVESFLSLSQSMGKEPNPLLAELSSDDFADAAALLLEHGLPEEAVRILDEGIRHRDAATLRYLLAYCHLVGSKLTAEAAQQLMTADQLPDEPPFPWRPIERQAMRHLATSFPLDDVLRRRIALMDTYLPQGPVDVE